MARDPQWLSRFVDLLNKAEALGLELRNGNALHDHNFTYSHKTGQYWILSKNLRHCQPVLKLGDYQGNNLGVHERRF